MFSIFKKPEGSSEVEAHSWIQRPAPTGFEFFHSRLSYTGSFSDADTCTECKNVFSRIRDQTKDPAFDQALKQVIKDSLCESFGYFKAMVGSIIAKNIGHSVRSGCFQGSRLHD